MNLDSLVLLNSTQFKATKTKQGGLRITEGFQTQDILLTFFTLIGLILFCFVGLTSMEQHNPKGFFQGWAFVLVMIIVLMVLFYIWYKGHVLFDNNKRVITIKRFQNKFFGSIQFRYEDVTGIDLQVNECINNSDDMYLLYLFTLKLKSGDSHKLFKIFRRKTGRYIKNAIVDHTNIETTEKFEPLT